MTKKHPLRSACETLKNGGMYFPITKINYKAQEKLQTKKRFIPC